MPHDHPPHDAHAHGDHSHHHLPDAPLREDLTAGAGTGKLLFVDAPSGIAGDMFVAAMLDLGVPLRVLDEALGALALHGYERRVARLARSGIAARRFIVEVTREQPSRDYGAIRAMLEQAALPGGVRDKALAAFARLAAAESEVHGIPADEVHFHEVGAVDSIVDIVAAAAALDFLGATLISSPLPLGHGHIHAAHGVLPLPAPATLLSLRGVPTYDGRVHAELVTPTGACLIASWAARFERWPSLIPERVGWGAGSRDLPDRPNLVRFVLGGPLEAAEDGPLRVIEANIDDSSAEVMAHAMERCLAAGALDVWTTAIGMKKGRPATMLSILCRDDALDALARLALSETSTLGVRITAATRLERPRRIVEVVTRFGPIPIKVADADGLPENAAPEYEACRAAAERAEVPLKDVYQAALTAWASRPSRPS